MKIEKIKIDELLPMIENPNVMKDKKFNRLVKIIEEVGYDQPMKVWWNEEKKKYEIVKGNHRFWALKLLGEKEADCVVGEYKDRDEALKDLVSDNIVKGELDPVKFTEMFDKLSGKYGAEALKEMFGFVDEAEFKRFYKEVKKQLPDELKDRLEEVRDEIKTIDDLSVVLNRLFSEYGGTLPHKFMIFDYLGGEKMIYIKCSKENWKVIEEITKYCSDNNKDINEIIKISINKE